MTDERLFRRLILVQQGTNREDDAVPRSQSQCQSPNLGLLNDAWATYPGALISLLMVWHVDMTYEERGECHVLVPCT